MSLLGTVTGFLVYMTSTNLGLAAVNEAQLTERWYRLKACPGPHCGWVFYDHSRNCSSSWCSMQVCGGRDRARRYRRRSREH